MSQSSGVEEPNPAEDGQNQHDPFIYAWTAGLLSVLEESASAETGRAVLKACALTHYRSIRMDELVSAYIGNLPGFIEFLTEQWQWKVAYDPQAQVITADENKTTCVCPIVQGYSNPISAVLCNCSEGFAERMFSTVAGRPVKAQVLRSILRGDPSCVYRIEVS